MTKEDLILELMKEQKETNKQDHKRIEQELKYLKERPVLSAKQITAIGGVITALCTGLTALIRLIVGV